MKRKINLGLLLVALMMFTLVGCGNGKDDEKESNTPIDATTESDSQTTDKFLDTSMDGGAPAPEVTPEDTKETTSEEVTSVGANFTLMSEDGSAVAFEGTVPEGLTLVSGDGTNHIEFAYDENPNVTVYLDGGADNNVLVANEYNISQSVPQYFEENPLSEATEAYALATSAWVSAYDFTINGEAYSTPSAGLNHLFYPVDTDGNMEYLVCNCNCHAGGVGNSGSYAIDPTSDEFGYCIWKTIVLMNYSTGECLENPFTITVRVDQPEVGSVSDDEMTDFNHEFEGGSGSKFAGEIVKSFSN